MNPMLSNMNDNIVVWAWVLWESYALGKGRSQGLSLDLGLNALQIVCISETAVVNVCAWML